MQTDEGEAEGKIKKNTEKRGKSMGTMSRKGMDHSRGKAIPPAGLTQSLCPKLGSILCHSEAEPSARSLET